MDYAAFHDRTTRQGQWNHGFLKSGETYVDDGDMRHWVFKVPIGCRRGFRAWAEYAFSAGRDIIVTGNYRDGYLIRRTA